MRANVFFTVTTGISLTALAGLTYAQNPMDNTPDYPRLVQKAVERSIPLMQKSQDTFLKQAKCISCHHQSLPSMAVALSRQHGFKVDEKIAREQVEFLYNFTAQAKGLLKQAETNPAMEAVLDRITVDPAASVTYIFAGLDSENWKSDDVTENAALYLAKKQTPEGYWPLLDARPPLQSSDFTTTAMAIRAIQKRAPQNRREEMAKRIVRAKEWLINAPAKTNEDRAFRLFGLKWAGADSTEIRKAVQDLIAEQHDDGGWGQLAGMGSDAYATGQALVALHQAGAMPIKHAVYNRGYKYLLKVQQPDGSWLVTARTTPVQVHVESGFPHGKSQFLSISGTAWATMALALTVEPPKMTDSVAKAAPAK